MKHAIFRIVFFCHQNTTRFLKFPMFYFFGRLRIQLNDINEGRAKVSPYLSQVDAVLSEKPGGATRIVMEPMDNISNNELAKQRTKLLQREYKKQNEMNAYLNRLFKTLEERNIKELSTLASKNYTSFQFFFSVYYP